MGLLEHAVRETLAARVTAPPTVEGVADRAIRAAGRIRRRRTAALTATAVVGALTLTLSVGLVVTGTTSRFGPGTARDMSMPTLPMAVDASPYVLSGGEITGPEVSVSVHGQMATRAWRVSRAFLVETHTVVSSGVLLWYVPVGEGTRQVLLQADQIVIAPAAQFGLPAEQGPVIAWSEGRTVSWGRLDGTDLVTESSTTVSAKLRVAGLVSGGVLLSTGDTFDLWFPDAGEFSAGPTVVSQTLVPAPDGRTLYGVVNGNGCLARLALHGFVVLDRTCSVAVGSQDALFPSPDGRWLAVASVSALRLFQLPAVFAKPSAAASWPLRVTDVSWLADGTLAALTGDGLFRLRTDESPRTAAPVPVEPEGKDSARTLVADLTAAR
jgi:hypothetical protein